MHFMVFTLQPFGYAMNKVEYKLIQKEKRKHIKNILQRNYSFRCKESRITKVLEKKNKNLENK